MCVGGWGGRMQLSVGSDVPLTLQRGGESESWVPKVTLSKVFVHKGYKNAGIVGFPWWFSA